MIKFTKYIKKEEELDLEYDEEFELQGIIYMINSDNQLYGKCDDSWILSDFDILWVYENKDKIIKQPQKPFWAEDGDEYHFIKSDGETGTSTFYHIHMNQCLNRKMGNCYKTDNITKEQIKEYLNKLNNKEIL